MSIYIYIYTYNLNSIEHCFLVHICSWMFISQCANCCWLVVIHGQSISCDASRLRWEGAIATQYEFDISTIHLYPSPQNIRLQDAPRIYKTTIDLEVCFPGGNVSFQLRCYLKLDPNIQLLQGTNQQSRVRRPFPPLSVKTIYQLELSLKLVTCSWKINIGPQRFSSSKQTRSW